MVFMVGQVRKGRGQQKEARSSLTIASSCLSASGRFLIASEAAEDSWPSCVVWAPGCCRGLSTGELWSFDLLVKRNARAEQGLGFAAGYCLL